MFRIIKFFVILIALVGFVGCFAWYIKTPQPPRMDISVDYLKDTIAYHYYGFKRSSDSSDDINYWRPIAREGNIVAQLKMAEWLFALGPEHTEAYEEAFLYLDILSDKGIPMAQNALAVLYCHGLGIEINKIECFKWFSLASSQGYELAEKNMLDMSRELTHEQMLDVENRVASWKMRYRNKKFDAHR